MLTICPGHHKVHLNGCPRSTSLNQWLLAEPRLPRQCVHTSILGLSHPEKKNNTGTAYPRTNAMSAPNLQDPALSSGMKRFSAHKCTSKAVHQMLSKPAFSARCPRVHSRERQACLSTSHGPAGLQGWEGGHRARGCRPARHCSRATPGKGDIVWKEKIQRIMFFSLLVTRIDRTALEGRSDVRSHGSQGRTMLLSSLPLPESQLVGAGYN